MRRLHAALLALIILTSAACHGDLFDVSGSGKYSYDIQTPRNYGNSGTRKWAVLVLLHGAGGLTTNPIATYSSYADSFPFILVTPHTTTEWEADRLSNVLHEVEDKYRVDEHRIYVTGLSMVKLLFRQHIMMSVQLDYVHALPMTHSAARANYGAKVHCSGTMCDGVVSNPRIRTRRR